MNTSKLQQRIYLDGRKLYKEKTGISPDAPVCAGTADNPAMRRLAETWAALKAAGKVAEGPARKVEDAGRADGPRLREAKAFTAALWKLKSGQVGEASGGLRPGCIARVTLPGGE